jgi:hypothetical protein
MRDRYARILAAGGAAILAATLGVPAASAVATAKTWTVHPGGGVKAMSGKVAIADTATGSTITCLSSTASGTLRIGSGLPGAGAGSLSAVSFATCAYRASSTLLVIFFLHSDALPWQVNLASYNAAKGVVRGTVSHLAIPLSDSASSGGCHARIDGTSASAGDGQVTFRYTDGTGLLSVLTTGGNLHLYGVSRGCLGIFHDGDPVTLSATYTLSPKQAITSP